MKSSEKENKIFKDKLEELDFEYNHQDWQTLQKRLDTKLKLSRIKKFGIAASVLAIVSIVAWQNFNNEEKLSTIKKAPIEVLEIDSDGKLNSNQAVSEAKNETSKDIENELAEDVIENKKPLSENKIDSYNEQSSNANKTKGEEKIERLTLREEKKVEEVASKIEEQVTIEGIQIEGSPCVGTKLKLLALTPLESINSGFIWKINGKLIEDSSSEIYYTPESSGILVIESSVKGSENILKEIQVFENSEIDFTYEDFKDPYNDLVVEFKSSNNNSTNTWIIEGEKLQAKGSTIIYTFKDKGLYDVDLESVDLNGCFSSIQKPISVVKEFDPLAPNAFTPDGDGLNDVFIPVGFLNRDDNFKMEIFDIKGKLVYSTSSTNYPWDGTLNNNGERLQDGMFIWKVSISNNQNQIKAYTGSVRLLRKN